MKPLISLEPKPQKPETVKPIKKEEKKMIGFVELTEEQEKELLNRFTYHKPIEEYNQPQRYEGIRNTGFVLAKMIMQSVPESREKSIALTKIEEAVMWANAAIARNEKQ